MNPSGTLLRPRSSRRRRRDHAANFYGGYFEELTPEQTDRQLATSLIGPMNVSRAVLPIMRSGDRSSRDSRP
jgi:NAD(P)-dependent dehydrogenase (short-subunit alcohol dehydrogenase family)